MDNTLQNNPLAGFGRTIVYRKTVDIVSRTIVDETIIVPISANLADMQSIFAVESVGAFIWEHIDGTRTFHDLHALVVKQFEVDPQTAEEDLKQFLSELKAAGIIVEKEQ